MSKKLKPGTTVLYNGIPYIVHLDAGKIIWLVDKTQILDLRQVERNEIKEIKK